MAPREKRLPGRATPARNAPEPPKKLRPLSHHATADWFRSKPSWSFALTDHAYSGEWGWDRLAGRHGVIFDFLKEMERLTWQEIGAQMYRTKSSGSRPKHHSQVVSSLCKEARDRLETLELDDVDALYRFRLGYGERLWGVAVPNSAVFCLLWWDPEHKVYPLGA